jgi:hypothetical protein
MWLAPDKRAISLNFTLFRILSALSEQATYGRQEPRIFTDATDRHGTDNPR